MPRRQVQAIEQDPPIEQTGEPQAAGAEEAAMAGDEIHGSTVVEEEAIMDVPAPTTEPIGDESPPADVGQPDRPVVAKRDTVKATLLRYADQQLRIARAKLAVDTELMSERSRKAIRNVRKAMTALEATKNLG
jgi:hypothetical protein